MNKFLNTVYDILTFFEIVCERERLILLIVNYFLKFSIICFSCLSRDFAKAVSVTFGIQLG